MRGPFRHRDFKLFWTGAFLSFVGSWIQTVAQGWLVYELTGDAAKLAFVTFANALPVSVFAPVAGTMADALNKRAVILACQVVFSASALTLAALTSLGLIEYWHIVAASLATGLAVAIEAPTRQSALSRIVPREELAGAIPIQGMTFNLARLVGPAIGGVLLAAFGAQTCFLVNGLSYLAFILALFAIKADLSASPREPQPVWDLVTEGVRYTFREPRLRTLFLMEAAVAVFGLQYIALMPAIAKDVLGLGERGLGMALATIGIGAFAALLLMANLKSISARPAAVRLAMFALGISLILMGFARSPVLAFPLFVLTGFATVTQFNSTNTLFQLIAPDRLRGRVLAMHVWALSGLAPIGTLAFGWVASKAGIPFSLQLGGAGVLLGALWAVSRRRVFGESLEPCESPSSSTATASSTPT